MQTPVKDNVNQETLLLSIVITKQYTLYTLLQHSQIDHCVFIMNYLCILTTPMVN